MGIILPDTPDDKGTPTHSDPDGSATADVLRDALTKITAAEDEVIRLAEGGRWLMRVPVREDADSDTVLMGALTAARAALAAMGGCDGSIDGCPDLTTCEVRHTVYTHTGSTPGGDR